MDLNPEANYFLSKIQNHYNFNDGILFKTALIQLKLNYSLQSIERLDQLFVQLRQKHQQSFNAAQFCQSRHNQNFLLLLTYYLGETIARQTGSIICWYSHAQANQILPQGRVLPDTFSYSIVGMVEGNLCLPLGIIGEHLFENQQPFTFLEYITQRIESIRQDKNITAQDRVYRFLYWFEQGEEFAGGLAYRSLLERAALDYSLDSLAQLDILLKLVRRDKQMSYDALLQATDKANFILLAGFYMLEVALRHTNSHAEWLGYEEINRLSGGKVLCCFETSHACYIQERPYFPLAVITEILFDPAPERECRTYVTAIIDLIHAQATA